MLILKIIIVFALAEALILLIIFFLPGLTLHLGKFKTKRRSAHESKKPSTTS